MNHPSLLLDTVTAQVLALSLLDKVKLMEVLAATIQHDLAEQQNGVRRSLYGLWHDLPTIADEDLEANRVEMWANFPREELK